MSKIYILAAGLLLSLCLMGCAGNKDENDIAANKGTDKKEDNKKVISEESNAETNADTNTDTNEETTSENNAETTAETNAETTAETNEESNAVGKNEGNKDAIEITRADELKELEKAKQNQVQCISISFTSRLLSEAKDGSDPKKNIVIYLPPGYYTSEKSYPVVYWFHGFSESPYFVSNNKNKFSSSMQEEGNSEFIVVGLDGKTTGSYFSFWSSSSVTGDWEGHVINEIVPFIDANFRTIAKAEARGTAGFSMGGYASINLAFKYPDIFKNVLSLGPGLLRDDGLNEAYETWKYDKPFLEAYARTFAPNPEAEALGDIPALDGSEEDNAICDKWLDGFGHVAEKVDNYLSLNSPLNKITIIYGEKDYYTWIPKGCRLIDEIMTVKNIEHTMVPLQIGHNIPSGYVEEYFVPFFSEAWTGVEQ